MTAHQQLIDAVARINAATGQVHYTLALVDHRQDTRSMRVVTDSLIEAAGDVLRALDQLDHPTNTTTATVTQLHTQEPTQ